MKKHFNFYNLAEREQGKAKAGYEVSIRVCPCGCAWANCGGSSSNDNQLANHLEGKISIHFEPQASA